MEERSPHLLGGPSLFQRLCGTKAHEATTQDVGPNGSPTWGLNTRPSRACSSQPPTRASGGPDRSVQVALCPREERSRQGLLLPLDLCPPSLLTSSPRPSPPPGASPWHGPQDPGDVATNAGPGLRGPKQPVRGYHLAQLLGAWTGRDAGCRTLLLPARPEPPSTPLSCASDAPGALPLTQRLIWLPIRSARALMPPSTCYPLLPWALLTYHSLLSHGQLLIPLTFLFGLPSSLPWPCLTTGPGAIPSWGPSSVPDTGTHICGPLQKQCFSLWEQRLDEAHAQGGWRLPKGLPEQL